MNSLKQFSKTEKDSKTMFCLPKDKNQSNSTSYVTEKANHEEQKGNHNDLKRGASVSNEHGFREFYY
ncbi:MAG: hypothetical protein A2309_02750 [Bacteroidetes bacterium RIFOXYB2_FULL_35_7]|nr:MAG: hypothetical protein A2X01_08365 [Bacteroidetes bacterium GWF2_35_48]OFY93445.1 MAG: hypothetical protein A2309_02750 [Bacteroidetes bacterium RIFOXYB2_FULL_35_7]OFY97899.1 MAG: hypothetical protein A2491_15260 [Bacteroidetes bacterium RIFOXYC12_FULL_35_7]HBX50845.1 hypothetical protein [Bacteroidales bacterium]